MTPPRYLPLRVVPFFCGRQKAPDNNFNPAILVLPAILMNFERFASTAPFTGATLLFLDTRSPFSAAPPPRMCPYLIFSQELLRSEGRSAASAPLFEAFKGRVLRQSDFPRAFPLLALSSLRPSTRFVSSSSKRPVDYSFPLPGQCGVFPLPPEDLLKGQASLASGSSMKPFSPFSTHPP